MSNHSATKKIAYNTGIQVIGKGVVMVLGAVSIVILTRYLGPAGYGNFTLALVYLTFFGIVADLGLFTIAVREMSKDESRIQEILGNTLSLRALLSVVVFSLAIGIGWLLPYTPDVKVAIAIAAVSHLFGLLNSSLITVFQTKLQMGKSVISDVIGRAASLAAVIVVVTLNWGFYAVVATAALGSFVTFVVSSLLVRRFAKLTFYRDTALWKMMFKESLPLGAALVVSQLYYRVDILMLSFMKTPADVGIYGAVFKVVELLMTLPGFFQNSVFPVLVRRLRVHVSHAQAVTQKGFDAMLLVGAGLAAGGLVLAPDIMRIIGGREFASGAGPLRVTLLAMMFTFGIVMMSSLYIALGKQVKVLKIGAIGLLLNVGLNLLLIPPLGIMGAAVVTLVSEAVIFALFLVGTRRQLRIPISIGAAPKIILAATVMVAAMWPLRGNFIIAFLVGSAVYGVLAVALRLVSRDIIAELRPRR